MQEAFDMYSISHSEIVKHGLLYRANELYQHGYTSMDDVFKKFEATHNLLIRYEDTAETLIRFKDECQYRYKINKEFVIANRRYLTDKVFRDKINSAFHCIQGNHKFSLTHAIEQLYMQIDFVVAQLVDYINKSCKSYRVKRRSGEYLELTNVGCHDATFVCNAVTLEGFQGYIKGKTVIRSTCPRLANDENWVFIKKKTADGVFYVL